MSKSSTSIAFRDRITARMFQLMFPMIQWAFFRSSTLEFATKKIARAKKIQIPTRHGTIRALLFSPTAGDLDAYVARKERPPVHVITHGGAFIVQYPKEESNVARYLASEVGCFVVIPDYRAAPQARFPVAEEQCYDAFQWVHAQSRGFGWDPTRISVGGPSAGAKLAFDVALRAIDEGTHAPIAVSSEFGCADMSRPNDRRTSTKKSPIVSPKLMDLMNNTYFKGVDLASPQVSPAFHRGLARLPPTLIMTAELDTLREESNDLARKLETLGVAVTHREFAGVDHGFTHQKPIETARTAITMIGDHLRAAYARGAT